MRLHQTWIAVSPAKKTVMLSPRPLCVSVPPAPGTSSELAFLQLGSSEGIDADSVWLAISQENTNPDE